MKRNIIYVVLSPIIFYLLLNLFIIIGFDTDNAFAITLSIFLGIIISLLVSINKRLSTDTPKSDKVKAAYANNLKERN
ncbi:hypothetical protein HPK19_14345 [Arthrobacter citreus]|nr:hypothetical protein HPK19_14345 [Arthrobacter citreus]